MKLLMSSLLLQILQWQDTNRMLHAMARWTISHINGGLHVSFLFIVFDFPSLVIRLRSNQSTTICFHFTQIQFSLFNTDVWYSHADHDCVLLADGTRIMGESIYWWAHRTSARVDEIEKEGLIIKQVTIEQS